MFPYSNRLSSGEGTSAMKRLKPSTRSLRTLGENGNLDANSEPGICFGTDSSDVNGYR